MAAADLFIWGQIPALAPGGIPPGASGRSVSAALRRSAGARRLQAERAALAAVAAAGAGAGRATASP